MDLREVAKSVLTGIIAAGVIIAVLLAFSGVWPPLVTVVTGSMEPSISAGDVVIIKDDGRFEDGEAITTYTDQTERSFGSYGDVIVFQATNGSVDERIIHRAMFEVEQGDNWYSSANKEFLPPAISSCEDLPNCPAPNDGYITKGDANPYYDQAIEYSAPVSSDNVVGEAVVSAPALGLVFIISMVTLIVIATFILVQIVFGIIRALIHE